MAKSYVLSGFVELEIPAPLKEVQTPAQHDKRLCTEHSVWCEKSESIWGQEDDMRGSAPIQLFLENPPSSKGTSSDDVILLLTFFHLAFSLGFQWEMLREIWTSAAVCLS